MKGVPSMANEEMFKNINNRSLDQQKNGNYSPSANYNFNQNQSNHSHHRNKKSNQHRKELHLLERLIKQNDVIIRILKDIRERLPEPPKKEKRGEESQQPRNREENSNAKNNTVNENGNGAFFVEHLTEEEKLSAEGREE